MRASAYVLHGMGDFIPGDNSAFLTSLAPVRGMGDFVGADRSAFLTSLNPKTGMGHIGCGSDCGCGPCRSRNGMGQIDFSLTGTGIVTSVEGMLNQSGWPAIPNWVFYAGGIAIVFAIYQSDKGKRHR